MKELILILLLVFPAQAQVNDKLEIKFRWEKWNESKWFTEDKFVHCFGGWILNNQLDKARPWWQAFLHGCSMKKIIIDNNDLNYYIK